MAHHKTKQQETLENLGMAVEDERTVFNFKVQKNEDVNELDVVVYVQFATPSALKKYPVVILEEGDFSATT